MSRVCLVSCSGVLCPPQAGCKGEEEEEAPPPPKASLLLCKVCPSHLSAKSIVCPWPPEGIEAGTGLGGAGGATLSLRRAQTGNLNSHPPRDSKQSVTPNSPPGGLGPWQRSGAATKVGDRGPPSPGVPVPQLQE